ncbi:deoxyribonuclease IV [Patescibacteria group bacterium]|nr:deoxyribonuclease IV [Patescibacteria group bacterium]
MFFGAHVSAAGGIDKAPANARAIGCEVFQMFSRPPQGGPAKLITPALIKSFKSAMIKNKQAECYIHTPYYINLASTNNRIRYGSIKVIREELERGSLIGVKYMMTHLGSANNLPRNKAIKKVIEGVKKILEGYNNSTMFLIENSAGSGNIIGDQFEEIRAIIKGVPRQARDRLAVCFDTCHAFSSNYDLRNKKAIDQTLKKFNQLIGLDKLKLIHINDSKTDLGSHIDRHEHIGLGKIGLKGFKELINHPKLKKTNMILETPIDGRGGQEDDLKKIKKLRRA